MQIHTLMKTGFSLVEVSRPIVRVVLVIRNQIVHENASGNGDVSNYV